ncbi:MAG TPA: 16S rRNA (adenine(1518)-N(6)/adenine(1519)-N(6))-dimethyltransferase RsmA [Candidatus Portnoybacteria bacterium]|nr:16S rRNA (adenine(1518)-N(6)/adenine(1519)-N(6))-dimethyltransferase RsmA [Candidatus Portnoybacteria bacterium]
MERENIKPNKLLGQNFLRDKNVLDKIIAAANLTSNDTILEIGPGEGILTEALAQSAGRVIAVEKDRNLAALLKIKLAAAKNIEIVEGDILECLNNDSLSLPQPYKVVANIPYYLTSHLIRLLLESAKPPQDIILMIQKEVAKRICAKVPEMSLLAAATQFYATPKIITSVSKNAFWPKPKVDSAIIKITPHNNYSSKINTNLFFKVAHAGFSHPRKQLLNNLSQELKLSKEIIATALETSEIKNSQRAETLTVEDWLTLAKNLDL